jgi:hypothetical protein
MMKEIKISFSTGPHGKFDFLGGEFIIIPREQVHDEVFARSREIYLLRRAEARRLQLQGEWAKLVTFDYSRPGRGFRREPTEDGGMKLGLIVDYHPVKPGDGYMDDDTGQFVKFRELRVERADERPKKFDEWWSADS